MSVGDEVVREWIEEELRLSQERLVCVDGEEVQYEAYLAATEHVDGSDGDSDRDIDSEEDDDEVHDGETNLKTLGTVIAAVEVTNDHMDQNAETIVFSDSDAETGEDSDGDVVDQKAKNQKEELLRQKECDEIARLEAAAAAVSTAATTATAAMTVSPNKRKKMVTKPVLTARERLRQSLKKKVLVAANENLCKQLKISTQHLSLRTQISERCRCVISVSYRLFVFSSSSFSSS